MLLLLRRRFATIHAYYSRFCLYNSKLRVIIMIMSRADGGLFIICLQRGHKQMILLAFDLEVCTMRFSAHRQHSRKLCVSCKFLSTWHALLADSYGEIEYLQLSDKSPLTFTCIKLLHHLSQNESQQSAAGTDRRGMKYPSR